MADHIRKQIRTAAVAALGGLATSGTRVFDGRTTELQDSDMPGLRIYTNHEEVPSFSMGVERVQQRELELVVECCSKKAAGLDDELDAMIKEVEQALAANQGIGGAKYVQLRRIEIDLEGEAERQVGVARMNFEVIYWTALGAPDQAR